MRVDRGCPCGGDRVQGRRGWLRQLFDLHPLPIAEFESFFHRPQIRPSDRKGRRGEFPGTGVGPDTVGVRRFHDFVLFFRQLIAPNLVRLSAQGIHPIVMSRLKQGLQRA